MVFTKFPHIARPGLTKPFAYGYAQSFVAATQQSPTTFPLNKRQQQKLRQNASHQRATLTSVTSSYVHSNRSPYAQSDATQGLENSLRAYQDAWQRLHQTGFSKHQGRNRLSSQDQDTPPESSDIAYVGDEAVVSAVSFETHRPGIARSNSTSALDDLSKGANKATGPPPVDGRTEVHVQALNNVEESCKLYHVVSQPSSVGLEKEQSSLTSTVSGTSPIDKLLASGHEHASESQSRQETVFYHEKIRSLQNAGSWEEIPPAFEAMLSRNLQPDASTYNALLEAALKLGLEWNKVVPKALNIYGDMLNRRVQPDMTFYSKLITTLCQTAIEFVRVSEDIRQQQLLFVDHAAAPQVPTIGGYIHILADVNIVNNALELFDVATGGSKDKALHTDTYEPLIKMCAQQNRTSDMIRIYEHMESRCVRPVATVFPFMISAFAQIGDLRGALECYNEYRSLAILDDAGHRPMLHRRDAEVYASLIRAYQVCGKSEAAQRFYEKVVENFATDTEARQSELREIKNAVTTTAFAQACIESRDFGMALHMAAQAPSVQSRDEAYAKICMAAANAGDIGSAKESFARLSSLAAKALPLLSIFAHHLRHGELDEAITHWEMLVSEEYPLENIILPAQALFSALVGAHRIADVLWQTRQTVHHIRLSDVSGDTSRSTQDLLNVVVKELARNSTIAPEAAALVYQMMIDGDCVSPTLLVSIMESIDPSGFDTLSAHHAKLLLRAQMSLLNDGNLKAETFQATVLSGLLHRHTSPFVALNAETESSLGQTLSLFSRTHITLFEAWEHYQDMAKRSLNLLEVPKAASGGHANQVFPEDLDPYLASTDFRGSSAIMDLLENHRGRTNIGEALAKFKNIRRGGRHPRYIVYAKLIIVAFKEDHKVSADDIFGMAQQDIPLLLEFPAVRHGWSAIFDAMIVCCLNKGSRHMAEKYHQQLLSIGCAPSANTFGLYITSLKDSSKSFDEATEAVKIFNRSCSEGVLPTSFLYNALIGKLGKARRIDDCLRYFQEMRCAGITPTSVTYGTVVNALCRVSDEQFAEELFEEMESMPNYKPRPAPYNSLMQYFLTTKRDSAKVLAYYERMLSRQIQPTSHTYKLLVDTYATLDPINFGAAEKVLELMRCRGIPPDAVHYASLIHAKGCVLHDAAAARRIFDHAVRNVLVKPHACLYQSLLESMVANHQVYETDEVIHSMSRNGISMTPYIANTLIHGWATEKRFEKARSVYDAVDKDLREPSTYEAIIRALLIANDRQGAATVVQEMLSRGYPAAVSCKILDLVGTAGLNSGLCPLTATL